MRFLCCIAALILLIGCGSTAITQTNRTERFTVELTLDGAHVGQRTIDIKVDDRNGNPIDAAVVVVAPVMLEMGMASPEMPATATGPGRYQVRGEPFSMLGRWQIEVRISADGIEEKTTFIVEIS